MVSGLHKKSWKHICEMKMPSCVQIRFWSTLTHLTLVFHFYTPESNRKPEYFSHFHGVYKWNIGMKWVIFFYRKWIEKCLVNICLVYVWFLCAFSTYSTNISLLHGEIQCFLTIFIVGRIPVTAHHIQCGIRASSVASCNW